MSGKGIKEFGAFVMTYQRPQTLISTLEKIRSQSFPPDLILVIDNSEDLETQKAVEAFPAVEVEYYRIGRNIGPAGAAKIGLQELADRGYTWIYWGDDDDPPHHPLEFENLIGNIAALIEDFPKLGVIGGKGGRMNRLTGRVRSLSNEELKTGNFVKVDSIPGGHTLIANAEVVRKGILPSEKLFFGFEELDFCLKVQKAGFATVVFSEGWLKVRTEAGNTTKGYRPRASSFGNPAYLWREYYSTRNLLSIYYRNQYYTAFIFWMAKSIGKSFAGFLYGIPYGRRNFAQQWKAIADFAKI